jgi:ubiquinone/menaquinone biosynthesis C-methylase UbiE
MDKRRIYYYDDDRVIMLASLARYSFALRYAAGKRVLDVGCGARKGPWLLAQRAESAIGLDIMPEALHHCQEQWPSLNANYVAGDAARLPFGDEAFETVTAFEVLEHLSDQAGLMQELRRVLKTGGTLVLSTPNRPIASPSGVLSNPDHVREFDLVELKEFLAFFFSRFEIYGQSYSSVVTCVHRAEKESYALIQKIPLAFRRLLPRFARDRLFKVWRRFCGRLKYSKSENCLTEKDFAISQDTLLDGAMFFVVVATKT